MMAAANADVPLGGAVLPLWRSLLYVPVTKERFIASAARSDADAIILDLEDAIVPEQKSLARHAVAPAVAALHVSGADVLVRVNAPWRCLVRDLEAAVIAGVRAIVLPKVRSAEMVTMVSAVMSELETERGLTPGGIGLMPLIECIDGFNRLDEIARADARVVALSLGDEDFSAAANCDANEATLFWPKQKLSLAAQGAGVLAIGYLGTLAQYRDLGDIDAMLARSKALGYAGAPCIHPTQIAALNLAFGTTEQALTFAHAVVAAAAAAHARGDAAFAIDGRMIDAPAYRRAKKVIELAARIADRNQVRHASREGCHTPQPAL